MIFGCVMMLLGVIPAAANWYSPFSEALTGKYNSMVPPVGGILIGIGIYSLTRSIWWALLAIPLDLGLVLLPFFLHSIVSDAIAHSKRNEIGDFVAFRDGHKTTLKLFKNSTARFTHSVGTAQYGFAGKWSKIADGYEIYNYLDSRICALVQDQQQLILTETIAGSHEENEIDLNGLIFTPSQSDG
ncbi:MAG: hypothetical protein R3C03_20865 [Pirellulaceae bacterium]